MEKNQEWESGTPPGADIPVFRIPAPVAYALDRLGGAGYECYLIGGCVRDFLRGEIPHDYDLTTSALPDEVHRVFSGEHLIDSGLRHGTVTLVRDGMTLEITTYRRDGAYLDGRHPEAVEYTSSLREDAARRDFTMNAVAYHPAEGIRDYFGGEADIRAHRIRAVGCADKRFSEDALRILRALRFAAVLGFSVEEETAKAIHRGAEGLRRISAERIQSELQRMLCGGHVGAVVRDFQDVLAPVLSPWYEAVTQGTRSDIDLPALLPALAPDPVLRAAGFFLPLAESKEGLADVEALMRRLRYDRRSMTRVLKLLSHLSEPCTGSLPVLRRFLAALGPVDAPLLLALRIAVEKTSAAPDAEHVRALEEAAHTLQELCRGRAVCTLSDLAVGGRDLMAVGFPRGERLGRVLQALFAAVLDGEVENERERLLAYARRRFDHSV